MPIPVTPLVGNVAGVLRSHQLHDDLHRATVPIHFPLRNVDTSSIAWAMIGITILASLLGLALLSTARTPRTAQPARLRPAALAAASAHRIT